MEALDPIFIIKFFLFLLNFFFSLTINKMGIKKFKKKVSFNPENTFLSFTKIEPALLIKISIFFIFFNFCIKIFTLLRFVKSHLIIVKFFLYILKILVIFAGFRQTAITL